MRMKLGLMSIAVAGLAVALTGCGSSAPEGTDAANTASDTSSSSPMAPDTSMSPSASHSATAKPVIIAIKDFKYTVPASVTRGAKITVKNDDAENHTLTSAPKGTFVVTANGGGGTATFTAPTRPGSYKFTCDFHADMAGTLVVK